MNRTDLDLHHPLFAPPMVTTTTTPEAPPAEILEQIRWVKILHSFFISSLFTTGCAGLGLSVSILSNPLHICPVLYAIYPSHWLFLGLSILQIVLAGFFLIWFLVTLFGPHPKLSSHLVPISFGPASGQGINENTNRHFNKQTASSTSSAVSIRLRPIVPNARSVTWCSRCPRIGWLCVASVFLVVLYTGLILALVLVVNQSQYFQTSFEEEFTNVFLEAKVNFNDHNVKPNKALNCWNQVQKYLQCCGLNKPSDWSEGVTGNPLVPDSCCKSHCSSNDVNRVDYTSGCLLNIKQMVSIQVVLFQAYLGITLTLLTITFIADLAFTLFLANATLSREDQMLHDRNNVDDFAFDATTQPEVINGSVSHSQFMAENFDIGITRRL